MAQLKTGDKAPNFTLKIKTGRNSIYQVTKEEKFFYPFIRWHGPLSAQNRCNHWKNSSRIFKS